jgi:CRISPR-associated protein Cas5h
MPFEKVLIFDVESEYGHFRKFNTTTSPLTYSFPTRSALIGLVGAVLGIERENSSGELPENQKPLTELFSKANAAIAVQLLNPVKKVNIGFNLLNTKASFFEIDNRTQIEFELLKHPKFRVFISCLDPKIHSNLEQAIQNGKSHFTPYLGLSQFTAKFEYVDVSSLEKINSTDFITISTVVNMNNTKREFDFEHNAAFKYMSDTMAIELSPDRVVQDYAEVLIEASGKEIKTKTNQAYKAGEYGNILFL